jgi:hypothetical protein
MVPRLGTPHSQTVHVLRHAIGEVIETYLARSTSLLCPCTTKAQKPLQHRSLTCRRSQCKYNGVSFQETMRLWHLDCTSVLILA